MFPGQGSQKKGMLRELHTAYPEIRQTFAEASDTLGYSMADLCFDDPEDRLGLTEFTQPALLCGAVAIWRLLQQRAAGALAAPLTAGHSLGEYSALVACGVLDFSNALRLVRIRGQAMQQAVPLGVGTMAAFLGDTGDGDGVSAWCREASTPDERVEVANENSPSQVVVSGHKAAVERFCQIVRDRRLGRAVTLPVSAPFHCSLMEPARRRMADELSKVTWGRGLGTIFANVDANPYAAKSYSADLLERQIVSRVRWTQTLKNALGALGGSPRCFVEVGPGSVLQGLAKKTLPGPEVTVLGSDTPDSVGQVLKSLEPAATLAATAGHS